MDKIQSLVLKHLSPAFSQLSDILDYILELKKKSSLWTLIEYIWQLLWSLIPQWRVFSVYTCLMMVRFLKGLENLFPEVKHHTLIWNLNLYLMRHPFDQMATCSTELINENNLPGSFYICFKRWRGFWWHISLSQYFSRKRFCYDCTPNSYQRCHPSSMLTKPFIFQFSSLNHTWLRKMQYGIYLMSRRP